MALTDYVIMPGADYQALCDKIREKTGKTDIIKSGDLVTEIEEVANSDGGSGEENWVCAQGSVQTTADGTKTVTHGLGVIPDIIMLIRTNVGPISNTTNKMYAINSFALSEKLLGETGLDTKAYGSCILYSPSSKGFFVGSQSIGLEHTTSSTILGVCDVTDQTMQLGTSNAPLLTNSTYKWTAYAKK